MSNYLFQPPKGEHQKHSYHSTLEKKLQDVFTPFEQFTKSQITASLLLLFATIMALTWASLPDVNQVYFKIVQAKLGIVLDDFVFTKSIKYWINDILLAFFFFLVGLEIKREFLAGELKDKKRAMLVLFAAIGGMAFPALIYLITNIGSPVSQHGWGIPMATDTAFALGLLVCFKKILPRGVFSFIAAMAIIDDIGAILVIAFFYSTDVSLLYLGIATLLLLFLIFLNYAGVRKLLPYFFIGFFVWLFFDLSHIHGSVAGILVAFTIPARPTRGPNNLAIRMKKLLKYFEKPNKDIPKILADEQQHQVLSEMMTTAEQATTPLQRWESRLETPVALLVLPLFALFNAGITLHFYMFNEVLVTPVCLGIILGLVVGKPLGISLMSYLCLKLKLGKLPEDTTFLNIVGVSFIAGIGFTMSLFVASLAFKSNAEVLPLIKLSVFISSIIATITGAILLLISARKINRV